MKIMSDHYQVPFNTETQKAYQTILIFKNWILCIFKTTYLTITAIVPCGDTIKTLNDI